MFLSSSRGQQRAATGAGGEVLLKVFSNPPLFFLKTNLFPSCKAQRRDSVVATGGNSPSSENSQPSGQFIANWAVGRSGGVWITLHWKGGVGKQQISTPQSDHAGSALPNEMLLSLCLQQELTSGELNGTREIIPGRRSREPGGSPKGAAVVPPHQPAPCLLMGLRGGTMC